MAHELGPGTWRLCIDIPIPSLDTLNVYGFELSDGSLGLIDTGWDDAGSRAALERELAAIGRRVTDVSRVVVTHAHPDHLGLAHHVRAVSGAQVFLHEVERDRLASSATGPRGYVSAAPVTFRRWGVEKDQIQSWLRRPMEVSDETWDVECSGLEDGERLPFPGWDLRVVWTPGHSPGHICLLDRAARRVFTGDHVLPRITPGVGAHPGDPDGDPLGCFLDSLRKVASLDVEVAHPAHEGDFRDVSGRAFELLAHHERRLQELWEIVERTADLTAWAVAQRLSWRRPLATSPGSNQRLALTETQAHLAHLERTGRLVVHDDGATERWRVAP